MLLAIGHLRERVRAIGLLLAGCALLACADDEQRRGVDKPVAPKMQTLDDYDAPTAEISSDRLDALFAQASTFVAAVDQLAIERTLLQSLRAGLAQLDRSGGRAQRAEPTSGIAPAPRGGATGLSVWQQALSLPGDGYLEIWRICDGWGVAPIASPDNGELHLIAGFTDGALDPVVWGTVTACRYRLGEHQVELDGLAADLADGDVRMYVGPNVGAEDLVRFPEPVVVELSAQATIDGRAVASTLNFRIDMQTRALELLVPLDGGHVLVRVDPTRGGEVEARASNGTFSCEMDALRCTGADGEELRAR